MCTYKITIKTPGDNPTAANTYYYYYLFYYYYYIMEPNDGERDRTGLCRIEVQGSELVDNRYLQYRRSPVSHLHLFALQVYAN